MQDAENNDSTVVDIICEFFEIAIHNILYVRKLYPDSIFERKRKYGVVVYHCIYPGLNQYILDCMKAINFHLKNNQLKNVLLCFTVADEVIEKYSFQVLQLNNSLESDPFLIKLEQYLSTFLLKLHSSVDDFGKLPPDASFRLQLQVTEYAHLEYSQDPANENFAWILTPESENNLFPAIVPLHSIKTDFLNLQMLIEKKS